MSGLPEGWIDAVMEDLADIQLGKMLDKTKNKGDPTPYLRNINVRWGSFDLSDVLEMRFTQEERVFFSIKDNDLIVCEGGEPGRAAIWRAGPTVLKYQKALHRVRLLEWVIPDFVYYFLRHASKQGLLESFLTGTTIKHLPRNAFLRFKLPLPPTNEQRRIVAKLDSLFERTRRAREELSQIPRLIENYKRAILEAAFRGALTKDWRDRHVIKSAWEMATVRDAIFDIRYGTSKKCLPEPCGTPVLRIPNVTSGGIDFCDLKFADLTGKELEKLSLKLGDVLVVRSNGSVDLVGRSVVVGERAVGYAYAGYLIRLRPKTSDVDPAFLSWMLSSPYTRKTIEVNARSTSGVHNINSEELQALPLPIPSLDEQREAVRLIQNAFDWLETVSDDVEKSMKLIDHLDRANVAKAFRGELVPHDQNDEPASVMLDRIRAERAGEKHIGRARRGRPAAGRELVVAETERDTGFR